MVGAGRAPDRVVKLNSSPALPALALNTRSSPKCAFLRDGLRSLPPVLEFSLHFLSSLLPTGLRASGSARLGGGTSCCQAPSPWSSPPACSPCITGATPVL